MSDTVVLIPHYNDTAGLLKSLKSVADCRFDIDVLIVDDGSDNKPSENELIAIYPKTSLILNPINQGIESALNTGLEDIANQKYKYIARLDCGDTCANKRFKLQHNFLEQNPDIQLLGSAGEYVNADGKKLWVFHPPCEHSKIRRGMYINNMFIHPSVMFRVEVIEKCGIYPLGYKYAEDYAMFFKIVKACKTENLPDVLLYKEICPNAISIKNRKKQILSRLKIIRENFSLSPWWFYGIFRNCILYLISGDLIDRAKGIFKR